MMSEYLESGKVGNNEDEDNHIKDMANQIQGNILRKFLGGGKVCYIQRQAYCINGKLYAGC